LYEGFHWILRQSVNRSIRQSGNDHSVHAARQQKFETTRLAVASLIGLANAAVAPMRFETVFDPAHYRGEEKISQVGNQHTNRTRDVRGETARDRAGATVQSFNRLEDLTTLLYCRRSFVSKKEIDACARLV